LDYARQGIVDADREEELGSTFHKQMAKAYALGLVGEMTWLVCHASHHAWQVNFLMEAAIFLSFLDNGAPAGKLDRAD
jgi:predicted thioredoxin/glutaredoxin